MTEHTPNPEQDPTAPVTPPSSAAVDEFLDAQPGAFAADAAEREETGQGPDPQDAAVAPPAERPLTAGDLKPAEPEPDEPEHDPALVGPTALENLLATDTTITIGDADARQTVRLRFDLLALANLEKRYGSVMAPMLTLTDAAAALEGGGASTADSPELIATVLEVVRIAAGRERFTVPDELRAGAAGAPVMPQRVRVKDQPDTFLEVLADGPETFMDLLLKVVAAFAAAFGSGGSAEGNVPSGSPGSPGGTGGTPLSESSDSRPVSSGA